MFKFQLVEDPIFFVVGCGRVISQRDFSHARVCRALSRCESTSFKRVSCFSAENAKKVHTCTWQMHRHSTSVQPRT